MLNMVIGNCLACNIQRCTSGHANTALEQTTPQKCHHHSAEVVPYDDKIKKQPYHDKQMVNCEVQPNKGSGEMYIYFVSVGIIFLV